MSNIKSSVTISLVDEARGGPFVFWDDFNISCAEAKRLGFDAVELFAPGPNHISHEEVQAALDEHGLVMAAVGTGAGMVIHQLSLSDPDEARRAEACAFVRSMIDFGAAFNAPAIIGSMQGRAPSTDELEATRARLAESLESLGAYAGEHERPLLFEPLNRYESNLSNTLADAVNILDSQSNHNIKLLADLFHMNIEEVDLAAAIREAGSQVGHVHFADTNRRAIGMGHLDVVPIVKALREIDYSGYISAEVFAWPNPIDAAAQTKLSFDQYFA